MARNTGTVKKPPGLRVVFCQAQVAQFKCLNSSTSVARFLGALTPMLPLPLLRFERLWGPAL